MVSQNNEIRSDVFEVTSEDMFLSSLQGSEGRERIGKVFKIATKGEISTDKDKELLINGVIQEFDLEMTDFEKILFSNAINSFIEGVNLTFDELIENDTLPESYKLSKPKVIFYKLDEYANSLPIFRDKFTFSINTNPNPLHLSRDILVNPESLLNDIRIIIEHEGLEVLDKRIEGGRISFADSFLAIGGQEAAHSIFLMANPQYKKENPPGNDLSAYNSTRIETDGLYGELVALYKKYEKNGQSVPIETEEFIIEKIKNARLYRLGKKKGEITDLLFSTATSRKPEGVDEASHEKVQILAAEKYLRYLTVDDILERVEQIYRLRNNPLNRNATGQIYKKALQNIQASPRYNFEEKETIDKALKLLSEIQVK